jgi:hypothetical protein
LNYNINSSTFNLIPGNNYYWPRRGGELPAHFSQFKKPHSHKGDYGATDLWVFLRKVISSQTNLKKFLAIVPELF